MNPLQRYYPVNGVHIVYTVANTRKQEIRGCKQCVYRCLQDVYKMFTRCLHTLQRISCDAAQNIFHDEMIFMFSKSQSKIETDRW